MGENSKISWTDHTMNFWIGCTETSPACDLCYAREQNKFRKWAAGGAWGASTPRHRTSAANWKKPFAWDREAAERGIRFKVFALSLGDWADVEVDPTWRAEMEGIIDLTPNLDWLLLSKRHAAVLAWARGRKVKPNVRIGLTVENQPWADIRLPLLRQIRELGWDTFVSYEPALGPVEWTPWMDAIGWLIVGGESGAQRRPFDENWARDARDACASARVPFFYKQKIEPNGRKVELPMLDGQQHAEFPVPAVVSPAGSGATINRETRETDNES